MVEYVTEAEGLEDSGFRCEIVGQESVLTRKLVFDHMGAEHIKNLYSIAVKSPVGAYIHCPSCNKKFTKKFPQTKFCSNKGSGNCKDYYWNSTDSTRFNRMKRFN